MYFYVGTLLCLAKDHFVTTESINNLSTVSFSQLNIINELRRFEVIVERKLCFISFNLLKVRSLEAVVTGEVNERR
jgi:hypothetical protein